MKTRITLGIAAFLLAVFWFTYVWPTPYRYYKIGQANLRVNRFTGETQRLYFAGWR